MDSRPILFLDVDGVLIPYERTESMPDSATVALIGPETDDWLLARIDRAHGERLSALGCDLVWATGWEDEANVEISPRLGLPQLPVVGWGFSHQVPGSPEVHWKTRDLIAYADGRPFVWIDDELRDPDREWVNRHHGAPALLLGIDPHIGLTETDIETVARWLADLSTAD